MNCKKAAVLISAATDGELSVKEKHELTIHLEECLECRSAFIDAKKTKLIVRERIVRFQAPQSLVDSIINLTRVTL